MSPHGKNSPQGALAAAGGAMLEVVQLHCYTHRAPLLRPFVTAKRRTEAVEYVVADLVLRSLDGPLGGNDGEAHGQGSAAETVAVTGEDAASIRAAINGPISAALVGARGSLTELSARIAGALPRATSAKEAVDVALHDAWARLCGLPLRVLLAAQAGVGQADGADGADGSGSVGSDGSVGSSPADGTGAPDAPCPVVLPNDMTVSLEEPEMMARRAREAAAEGYRTLKIKLGRDITEDLHRLDAVLEAVPEARLRLDANQGWQVREAIEIITEMERRGLPVDLVEQPVAEHDLEGMAQVRSNVATPIMADESIWTAADARQIVDLGAADLLNIKLAKTGGLQEALAVAHVAHEAGLECMVGAMMEPRISITAAAHLAAAHPSITMIDLDSALWFTSDLPRGGYEANDGALRLLEGPGLALEPLAADDDPADHPVG